MRTCMLEKKTNVRDVSFIQASTLKCDMTIPLVRRIIWVISCQNNLN